MPRGNTLSAPSTRKRLKASGASSSAVSSALSTRSAPSTCRCTSPNFNSAIITALTQTFSERRLRDASRYAKPIVLALFAIWVMGFAYQVGRSSQQQEYRKKIEATYKASESIDGQGGSHRTNSRPHQPSAPQTSEGRHETPEIAFVGIKLGE